MAEATTHPDPDPGSNADGPEGPLGTTLRVGTVVACRANPKARRPALVLEIDLGPLGIRTSSAQLTRHYDESSLVGRQVVVATDLGSRLIAGVRSEVLVLGLPDDQGETRLLVPDAPVPNGGVVH